jgi:site-specific recombinase XerC
LTLAEASRIVAASPAVVARLNRDRMRDKSYQLTPLGAEVAAYLRQKRKRLTDASYRDYEGGLDRLARHFEDLQLADFEPPVGTRRLEEFLDHQWGSSAPRTLNKNLSILRDFFKWAVLRGELHGDPTLPIERARARGVYRTTFNTDQRRAIIASQEDLRDRTGLRLLLDYGLRKGALTAVQFKHFDHHRRRLTVFTKAEKIRELPIPEPMFWRDLERIILEDQAQPGHYLIPGRHANQHGTTLKPTRPLSGHGMHDWWYRCLQNAGIVPTGITAGERMHKARHTAGQRILDATGNLKAVQKLLGHASIQTTGDVYADWDIDQLAATLADVLAEEEEDE